jgi:hypothetical protein
VAIRVVGVADSSSLLVAKDVHSTGLDDALLTQLCAAKSAGSPLSSLLVQGRQMFPHLILPIFRCPRSIVFVDM